MTSAPIAFIAHHGVQGMHWGVRRYQNKDGTLTEAGKRHYSKSGSDPNYRTDAPTHGPKEDLTAEKVIAKGKSLSDEELQASIWRMKLEKQYDDLSADEINAGKVSAKKVLKEAGGAAATAVGGQRAATLKRNVENAIDSADELIKTGKGKSEAAKKASEMSDRELKKAVNRLEMEKEYRDLSLRNSNVKKGEKFIHNAVDLAANVTTVAGTVLAIYAIKKKLSG